MKLTTKALIHNSGADLWDYIFHNVPLKYMGDEDGGEDSISDDPKWLVDGLKWLENELLEGEKWDFHEVDHFVYTNYGRVANLKKKLWRKTQMQASHITTTIDGIGFSVTSLVSIRWGTKLDYFSLPEKAKEPINTHAYFNKLEKKRK